MPYRHIFLGVCAVSHFGFAIAAKMFSRLEIRYYRNSEGSSFEVASNSHEISIEKDSIDDKSGEIAGFTEVKFMNPYRNKLAAIC
jgi:hypothetical protein